MVTKGEFREDLYYRLNVVPIVIPSLKERKEDIFSLLHLFLEMVNEKYGTRKTIDNSLHDFFHSYHWPGNVRELANLIERLTLMSKSDILSIRDLPGEYTEYTSEEEISSDMTLKEVVEMAEKRALLQAVKTYKSTYEIAQALDTSQPTIVRKLQKYDIKPGDPT